MGKIIDNYSLQVELGSGIYSTVYKAINLKTNEVVAIKMIKTIKFRELPKLQQGAINEINILTKLQPCPNIIKYYDMLKTTNHFYFVYQFCNGGTLQQKLRQRNYFGQKQALLYFKQIVEAFKILTKNNIMHRDLKPQNILLHNDVVKIADFGFCKILEHQDQMSQTMLGSPIYMAPQILKGQNYTIKADIWSLGIVLFRMFYGFCPYQSANIANLITLMETKQLKIPAQPNISPIALKLLKKMLTKDPIKRADWNEVFSYEISKFGIITNNEMSSNQNLYKNYDINKIGSTTTNSTQSMGSVPSFHNKNFTNFSSQKNISPKKQNVYQQKTNNPTFLQLKLQRSGKQSSMERSQNDNSSHKAKSPYSSKTFTHRIDTYIKNHSKHIELVSLCIEISNYGNKAGLQLAYYILKGIQNDYSNMIDTINRQKNNEYQDILSILIEQSKELQLRLLCYSQQIESQYDEIKNEKRMKLKCFIKKLSLQTNQQLVMTSRLIDYIEQNLLIRKQTYEKLSKDQLSRQIRSKFQ